jgi:multicomponent Na+:H+ antiporter subunit E
MPNDTGVADVITRRAALFCWSLAVWVLLTWTLTVEQLLCGVFVATVAAVALAPLGGVAGPWQLLGPRRFAAGVRLLIASAGRVAMANLRLSRRIWDPRQPLASGMVISPTKERSDGGLAAVGLITSLIVETQIVDLDRREHELQYHAVPVPDVGTGPVREKVNGPVEDLLEPFCRRPGK